MSTARANTRAQERASTDDYNMHASHNVANYKNGTYTCIIPDGNYTPSELVNTINVVLETDFVVTVNNHGLPIRFYYNANTNKITIRVNWQYFNNYPAVASAAAFF